MLFFSPFYECVVCYVLFKSVLTALRPLPLAQWTTSAWINSRFNGRSIPIAFSVLQTMQRNEADRTVSKQFWNWFYFSQNRTLPPNISGAIFWQSSAPEMTYIVSGGALNSTHSLISDNLTLTRALIAATLQPDVGLCDCDTQEVDYCKCYWLLIASPSVLLPLSNRYIQVKRRASCFLRWKEWQQNVIKLYGWPAEESH